MYMCICMYVQQVSKMPRIYTFYNIQIHVYIDIYIRIYVYMYIHIWYTYISIHTYICTYICTYIQTHIYIYIYVCMYMYYVTKTCASWMFCIHLFAQIDGWRDIQLPAPPPLSLTSNPSPLLVPQIHHYAILRSNNYVYR